MKCSFVFTDAIHLYGVINLTRQTEFTESAFADGISQYRGKTQRPPSQTQTCIIFYINRLRSQGTR
jgi:hypothetical protein